MSQPTDEARAARIHKYKEERRKQLTARSATLFSGNVTERRPRKGVHQTPLEDTGANLKSSSDLCITSTVTSVPIRTTRTSRLRAAAASSLSASNSIDDVKKTHRTSKIIERDKKTRRPSHEGKENVKNVTTTSYENDNGAIKTKIKHSSNKLEKGFSPKEKNAQADKNKEIDKNTLIRSNRVVASLGDDTTLEFIDDRNKNGSKDKQELEDLFKNLKVKDGIENGIANQDDLKLSSVLNDDVENKKTDAQHIPEIEVNEVPIVDSVTQVFDDDDDSGLVCVRKVERFSELLSTLCSPREDDLLLDDILADCEAEDTSVERVPGAACAQPCRRTQPSSRTSTNKRGVLSPPTAACEPGTDRKAKEASESSTTRITPRNALVKSPTNKLPSHTPSCKPQERRRSSDGGSKPSCIPLSKKSAECHKSSSSPVKQDLTKGSHPKLADLKTKFPRGRSGTRSPEKSKSDSETNRHDRRHRAQNDSQNICERYHSKKRLTSLENNSSKDNSHVSNLPQSSNVSKSFSKLNSENIVDNGTMSTLHEQVRPHTSRLSQEMDSLTALTKQTLDRVNKLSNNLAGKVNVDSSDSGFDALMATASDPKETGLSYNYGLKTEKQFHNRGVNERLRDIDTAAQRLIDFEKQSATFSDLNNDSSSQYHLLETSPASTCHTPVSILKRKSINEDVAASGSPNHAIATPPVTFSPNVEAQQAKSDRQRQGILKKRRSLDESHVARRRSCSPEVSFAEDESQDATKPILKNRRSSLEDVVRNRSPDGQIQGILKRKMSREEEYVTEDASNGSPEPQGILKRKSNSSSSSSTTSSHVSIAQAVLLAAAGGAEIVDDDKETVRPILKKKSYSEERPIDIPPSDTPKPILKKKSLEHDEFEFEMPKKPILKISKKSSGEEGHSSFELSEDDRGSRRSSLLRTRASDHSGSECETTVRPILKQRGSSLTRERSQSPRPRLSFCEAEACGFISDPSDASAAGLSRAPAVDFPSAVLRRRNLRPKSNSRSKSYAGNFNDELLSILNNRRQKVDNSVNGDCDQWDLKNHNNEAEAKQFPSIATRIRSMEKALTKDLPSRRDRDRFKTQPVTVNEMRLVSSSLEPGQQSFQEFGPISFTSGPSELSSVHANQLPSFGPYTDFNGVTPSYVDSCNTEVRLPKFIEGNKYGEANILDFDCDAVTQRQSTLDEIEQEVEKVLVALDEESRALDEDERQQEADTWSLNVSCDSGVYNRASSRDSGPHSGEELGLIESQEIQANHATNSGHDWSTTLVDQDHTMDRQRNSTVEDKSPEGSDGEGSGFALGLVKSSSVVARASMWQQLQQQAKGLPKPLLRHGRSKRDGSDRFKTQTIAYNPEKEQAPQENFGLAQSKSSANVLDRDEDAKLDENDPAKMSLAEKMKLFNSKLTHKPPPSGLPKHKDERSRTSRLKTMPVLASQVQEAIDNNELMSRSLTHEEVPRNPAFAMKMELFRSASAKNTSLQFIMKQDPKFRSLELDEDSPIESPSPPRPPLKHSSPIKHSSPHTIAKGESSEGLKDEGIDSSSDDDSTSTVSSSEKSCSSSESCDEKPGRKPRRFQNRKNKLKPSKTDSDLAKILNHQAPGKIQLPGAHELKERFAQNRNASKPPLLGRLNRSREEKKEDDETNPGFRRVLKKIDQPIELGKLKKDREIEQLIELGKLKKDREIQQPIELGKLKKDREIEQPIELGKLKRDRVMSPKMEDKPPILKCSVSPLSHEAKMKYFGLDKQSKSIDDAMPPKRHIPPCKSISTAAVEASGSDGDSSGGREVRYITHHRGGGGGVQRSATAEMPHRGGTIAERLAALQAAGANDWRARVCRLSPESDDTKAIERAKNRINESLNAAVDEKKKAQIEDNELGSNILAERRNKLETAAQGWRKRVPQNDANLFTVAGRLERNKVTHTPPPAPPPAPAPASPGIPIPNTFRSRKQPSPTNGFPSGPLRSASCALVAAADRPKEVPRPDRDAFKRSHSISESIATQGDEQHSPTEQAPVPVPRADDETFQAFFAPLLQVKAEGLTDVDLDAIDSQSRQLLSSDHLRRAKRERRHVTRNPLKALAARTDLKQEYTQPPNNFKQQYIKEKATANCGLAAEALAALASKEDFSNVALRSASANNVKDNSMMLLQVKGRRRVQTRLVQPIHTCVNRGDCFILVTPDQLYLYIGFYANVIERNRSTDVAQHILNNKDLGCKNATSISMIDEQNKNFSNKHWTSFWTLLGVKENVETYKPVEAGHPDEDEIFESCLVQTNMSYEVIDDELVPIKEYWGQVPKIAMLNQTKTLVFDFGSEMYIWYGKNVLLESRRRSAQLAQELFDEGYNYEDCHINPVNAAVFQGTRAEIPVLEKASKIRPEWAKLTKVTQHMESILFKEKFLDWPDYSRVIKVKPQENKTPSTEITPCDAEEMWAYEYQEPDLVLEGSHLGRGTHYYDKETMRHFEIRTKSVSKWIIQEYDYQKVENESELGEFYSGDSYIIRWEYQVNATGRELNGKPSKHNLTGRDRCAYFCWQGRDASSNEKGAAALLTVELDKERGPQVRVAQGNEPPAFLNLFQGNLVIHQGKKNQDKSRYKLFVTRGNVTNEAYLLQVPCSMKQLRTRGSLLLVDTQKGSLHIWHGSRSMKHTKNVAIELANKLIARKSKYLFGGKYNDVKITEVKEGEEPSEVLEALGGNKQFYKSVVSDSKEAGADVTMRLFHFTDLSGQFEAHEVLSPLRHEQFVTPYPFEQRELYSASQPALFLVDDGLDIWVWQGAWPNDQDEDEAKEITTGVGAFAWRWQSLRIAALRTAEAYHLASGSRRPPRLVVAGLEPAAFAELFDTWQHDDTVADRNIQHGYKSGTASLVSSELARLCSCSVMLSLAELQRRPLPPNVNPHALEKHLHTDEFMDAFGMTKEEFEALPAWKQTSLKKDVGLF